MGGLFGVEIDGAGAVFGVVIAAETIVGAGCRAGRDEEVGVAIAMEVEGFARAVFVFDARDYDVGEFHGNVGAAGMAFRHGVAGGNDKINGNFGVFGVSIFAGVEQGVAAGSIYDFIVTFREIGIHTNTPFLIMYSFCIRKRDDVFIIPYFDDLCYNVENCGESFKKRMFDEGSDAFWRRSRVYILALLVMLTIVKLR